MIRGPYALAAAVVTVVLAEALAIALLLIVPEKRTYWLIATLTMPILWAGAELMKRDKASLRLAISYAALMLALVEALAIARAVGLIAKGDEAFALRFLGMAGGLVILAFGNMLPKRAGCVDPAAPDAARRQKLQRYSAWVFVLAGLANTAIWALAPIKQAALWSMVPVAGGLALIALRISWSRSVQGSRA